MKTLKNVLLINGLSSGATGIGLVILATPIALLFGLETPTPLVEVGIFLVAFAILVFRESRRDMTNLKMLKLIIALDTGWVITSLVVVTLQLFNLTPIGYLAVGLVALWVAAMAWLQWGGLKRLTVG